MMQVSGRQQELFPFANIARSLWGGGASAHLEQLAALFEKAGAEVAKAKGRKAPGAIHLGLVEASSDDRLRVVVELCMKAKIHGICSLVMVGSDEEVLAIKRIAGQLDIDLCNIGEKTDLANQGKHRLIIIDQSVFSAPNPAHKKCIASLIEATKSWSGALRVVAFISNAGSKSQ
jgi:hypothetical protein